jgi:hypothetical protein
MQWPNRAALAPASASAAGYPGANGANEVAKRAAL